jgi:hypothetical protein
MQLLDHADMTGTDLSTKKSHARLIPALAAEMNAILAKHGLKDVEIHSFSFGNKPGLVSLRDPKFVQGVGLTKEGVWVVANYEK